VSPTVSATQLTPQELRHQRITDVCLELFRYRGCLIATGRRVPMQEMVRERATQLNLNLRHTVQLEFQSMRLFGITLIEEIERYNARVTDNFKLRPPFTRKQINSQSRKSFAILHNWLLQFMNNHHDVPTIGWKQLIGLDMNNKELYESFKLHYTVYYETYFYSNMPFTVLIENIIARELIFFRIRFCSLFYI
jgi:hypothetical protein